MHAALRSPLLAGVTLIGASAIAVTPMAATAPNLRVSDLRLTLMQQGLENPIEVFAPILQQTLADNQALISDEINNPAPILRAVLSNMTDQGSSLMSGLTAAGTVLGAAAFDVPAAVVKAGQQAAAGDFQGALTTLANVTVVPVKEAAGDVVAAVRTFIMNQVAVAQRLMKAIPDAAMGIVASTVNAITQVTQATVAAGLGVVQAVSTGDPVKIANAITDGSANVASVAEQDTIGQPVTSPYQADAVGVQVSRTPSIAVAVKNGRTEIARAIPSAQQEALASTTAASSSPAAPSLNTPTTSNTTTTPALRNQPTGPIRTIVKDVRTEIRTAVKDLRKAPGGGAPKAKAAR